MYTSCCHLPAIAVVKADAYFVRNVSFSLVHMRPRRASRPSDAFVFNFPRTTPLPPTHVEEASHSTGGRPGCGLTPLASVPPIV
jgi:hypothetical protein